MYNKKLLNISDFAKIAGVSRQTLIYYDRIGLFSPVAVGENGYRMYSHNQIDNISIITILQDLGVSLKKIKEIIADISIETTKKTLNYQLSAITQKIEKLSLLNDMVKIRLEQIEIGEKYANEPSDFFIKECTKEIPIHISKKLDAKQDSIGDEKIIEFFDDTEKIGLPLIFTFGYIKRAGDIARGDFDSVSHLWFRLKSEQYANAHIPIGKYLIGHVKGNYGDTNYIYNKLLAYANEHNLKLLGNAYEEYLIDELSEKNPDNFILEIGIQVETKNDEIKYDKFK